MIGANLTFPLLSSTLSWVKGQSLFGSTRSRAERRRETQPLQTHLVKTLLNGMPSTRIALGSLSFAISWATLVKSQSMQIREKVSGLL
jgi:hypothetical protein